MILHSLILLGTFRVLERRFTLHEICSSTGHTKVKAIALALQSQFVLKVLKDLALPSLSYFPMEDYQAEFQSYCVER